MIGRIGVGVGIVAELAVAGVGVGIVAGLAVVEVGIVVGLAWVVEVEGRMAWVVEVEVRTACVVEGRMAWVVEEWAWGWVAQRVCWSLGLTTRLRQPMQAAPMWSLETRCTNTF